MESAMDLEQTPNSRCAVCGRRSAYRASWYLVSENSWLDRLKIFSWHPVLAEQSAMHSLCGNRHLELLITHWLTYANLRFQAVKMPECVLADHEYRPGEGMNLPHPGQLVGELAIHREPVSRLWTGSPEAREGIFRALSGACEAQVLVGWKASVEVESMPMAFEVVPPDSSTYVAVQPVR